MPKQTRIPPKKRKFLDLYLKYGEITRAGVEAGYSKKYAQTDLAHQLDTPRNKAYLEKRMHELETSKIMDPTQILEFLSSVAKGETTETIVTVKGREDNVPSKTADRVRAAELLGKRWMMWTDRVKVAGKSKIKLTIGDEDKDKK